MNYRVVAKTVDTKNSYFSPMSLRRSEFSKTAKLRVQCFTAMADTGELRLRPDGSEPLHIPCNFAIQLAVRQDVARLFRQSASSQTSEETRTGHRRRAGSVPTEGIQRLSTLSPSPQRPHYQDKPRT